MRQKLRDQSGLWLQNAESCKVPMFGSAILHYIVPWICICSLHKSETCVGATWGKCVRAGDEEGKCLSPDRPSHKAPFSVAAALMPPLPSYWHSAVLYTHASFKAEKQVPKIKREKCVGLFDSKRLRLDWKKCETSFLLSKRHTRKIYWFGLLNRELVT